MTPETLKSVAQALRMAADRGRDSLDLSDVDLYTDLPRQTVAAALRGHLEELRALSGLPKLTYMKGRKPVRGHGNRAFQKSPGASVGAPARVYLNG